MQKNHKLIIIGSGPAGLTAAIYAARANLNPLVIEGNNPGGQLMQTSLVENWPGIKSIMGPDLMIAMREHAQKMGATLLSDEVTRVTLRKSPFLLETQYHDQFTSDALIIATGSSPKKLNCPGEDTYWGKGITSCAICDAAFYKDKPVIIVGGGDTAMEDAYFLKKFTNKITIVQHIGKLTASHAMQKRVVQDPDIKILYNTSVKEFKGNDSKLTTVTLIDKINKEESSLSVEGAFIAIGQLPNTSLFETQLELDKWGYIVTKDENYTSIPGVFVAGDAQDYRFRQAIVAAGSGCKAALLVENYLANLSAKD